MRPTRSFNVPRYIPEASSYYLAPDLTDEQVAYIAEWCGGLSVHCFGRWSVRVETPEGPKHADPGSLIVRENGVYHIERPEL